MIEITYAKNAYDSQTKLKYGKPIKPEWETLQFNYKRWKRGDPLPEFGTELGIDTETELITDTRQVPPLVVLGVYNPPDNTCYIVPWNDAQVFMHEILIRDCKIFLANAGFDYYELLSEELQQAAADRKIIDILIRGALKEIATIGFIRTYSLKDACKWHLLYLMDKHEDEGDASVRLNFKTNKPLTDEECEYLSIDCATTYLAGHLMGPQATEDTHTLGSIVLTHIRNNGMEVDEEVFSYCENLLKSDMQVYRQQLIQFGFPDPLKKQEKTEMELLEEGWVSYITGYFKNFYEETYYIPTGIPNKVMCKRLLLYGMNFLKKQENKTYIARNLTTIMIQKKSAFSKAEQSFWDRLCEDMDFLVPCDTSRKKCVWPLLLKKFLDDFLSIGYEEGLTYEVMKENLDEYFQDHPEWVTDVPEVKPTDFIQDHLKKLEQEHKGLQFARTDKTGLLKCSKKDGWILADFDVKDPFLEAYMNFVHVQKYLSTYCNRAYIKADGKVHSRYGIVATGRTSATGINCQQLPSHDKRYPLKNMFRPPKGTILVSTDYSFAELVALAQNCLTKYGHSVLAEIINADVCPHYFFEGVILGLIKPDVSFCKDPEKVAEMKAFLKEHVTKEQRQVAKAVNFGCPGCMGPARLYQHLRENGLKVTRKEAEDLLNCWLSTFPEMQYHFNSRPVIKNDPYSRYGIGSSPGEDGMGFDDDPFKEKRKTRKLYRAQTITGFVRNRATQNAACNCDFQNPVAHLAKEALWNLEMAGLGDRLFCFVHDEIDYWLYPHEVRQLVPLVEELWLEPGKRVFPDVKLKCESSLSLYWDKGGTEFGDVQWDDKGLPILEVPEFVKKIKERKT